MAEPQLERRLGLVSATAIVVSNMIGTGIFTASGFLAGQLGSPTLVVAIWFAGAAIALAGALCYSELGVNFPRSGGEYVYLTEAWGPAWGFIDGWVSFFAGFSAPIAAAALGVAAYVGHFAPGLDPQATAGVALGPINLQLGGAQWFACGLIVVFTALNLLSVDAVAKMQNGLTGIKLFVLGALLLLGFTVGTGDWAHFSQAAERTSTTTIPAQFALSLVFVYFGYSGWNAAVYVAEEIKDPERTLPRSLVLGTILVAVFYAALNCLFIYATPLEQMKGVVAVGAQAAQNLFGDSGGGIFAAGMALSLLATVNAMCMIGPRVYYAMARNGAFFSAAGKVHPKWKSPWVAVTAQGVCCCLLIVTGTFESLLYYIGFTLWLFSALSVLALVKFRGRPGWKRSPWVSFGWPLIPGFYMAVNLFVFVYFTVDKSWEALWSLLTIAAGGVAYYLYRRSGAN
jgi:APA family basic amino acid/polyamine antiporter